MHRCIKFSFYFIIVYSSSAQGVSCREIFLNIYYDYKYSREFELVARTLHLFDGLYPEQRRAVVRAINCKRNGDDAEMIKSMAREIDRGWS